MAAAADPRTFRRPSAGRLRCTPDPRLLQIVRLLRKRTLTGSPEQFAKNASRPDTRSHGSLALAGAAEHPESEPQTANRKARRRAKAAIQAAPFPPAATAQTASDKASLPLPLYPDVRPQSHPENPGPPHESGPSPPPDTCWTRSGWRPKGRRSSFPTRSSETLPLVLVSFGKE